HVDLEQWALSFWIVSFSPEFQTKEHSCSFWNAPSIRWECASCNPGITNCPFRSIVLEGFLVRTSSVVPTARNTPFESSTRKLSAYGAVSLTVYTMPLIYAVVDILKESVRKRIERSCLCINGAGEFIRAILRGRICPIWMSY